MLLSLPTITLISSGLGAAGALTIIAAFVWWPTFKSSVIARLALSISVADFIAALAYGANVWFFDAHYLCQLQGFLQVAAEVAGALLVLCVALNLVFVVRSRATFAQVQSYDSLYIPVAWALGVTFASIPLFMPAHDWYGPSTSVWCFLTHEGAVMTQMLYALVMAVFLFGAVTVVIVKIVERKRDEEHIIERFRIEDRRLVLLPGIISMYLVAYVVAWSPLIAVYLYTRVSGTTQPIFDVLIAALLPLRGMLNALVGLYQAWVGDHSIALAKKQLRLSTW